MTGYYAGGTLMVTTSPECFHGAWRFSARGLAMVFRQRAFSCADTRTLGAYALSFGGGSVMCSPT